MALIDEGECRRQVSAARDGASGGALARLYVVCGGEGYLKQHYAAQLCEAAVGDAFRDFNFHRFEGKDLDLDTLAQAARAVPLMGERTCVLVRDFPLESANGDKDFLGFLRELPEHAVLVFWMDTQEFHPKKYKALAEALNAVGHIAQFDAPDETQTLRIVAAGAKKRGCVMDRAAAAYFVECVGGDLNLLQNELDKLCAYAGGGNIAREQVDAVCVKSVDAKSFDMVKAVSAGDGSLALRLLDELFRQKVAPQMLLGSLVANYVDIYRAFTALQAGKSAEAPANLFDYKGKTFRLQNAGRVARGMKLPQVKRCLELLAQADRRLKNTGMDDRLVMEQCIIGLLEVR
ncbi:MAG: DNA polymerase III subunit delta [Oscillospiraceae bacterium]|nr:DNA polymerase III subunit delta [Oscillospiraceae bacterium]